MRSITSCRPVAQAPRRHRADHDRRALAQSSASASMRDRHGDQRSVARLGDAAIGVAAHAVCAASRPPHRSRARRRRASAIRRPSNRRARGRTKRSKPSLPRTATVRASRATSRSGRGRRHTQRPTPAAIGTSPSQRQPCRQISDPQAAERQAGPAPPSATPDTMETAPGRPETKRPTASIASMPQPMTRSGQASSPNGIRITDKAAAGIVDEPHHRHRQQIADHGVMRGAVEMEDGIRRGRQAADEAGGGDAAHVAAHAGEGARGRRLGAARPSRAAPIRPRRSGWPRRRTTSGNPAPGGSRAATAG